MSDNHSSHHDAGHGQSSATSAAAQSPAAQQFVTDPNINYFGLTNFRNQYRKFGIKVDDRLRHVYVIGKSGMGKSTLLENMIINDIYAGHGVGIIDPHGDLADSILDYIPEHRIKDVIYFNPADLDHPVGFNILEQVAESERDRIADGIKVLFKKIWPDVWSPRMEYILVNSVLALLDFPGATLMSINRMLADDDYHAEVVKSIKNPAVKAYWEKEYSGYNDKYKQEAVAPVQNKVGQFLAASLIRNIVAQTKSTFNIRDIMDSRKIFLVNLSKGLIGEDNSKLLGGMLVTKLYTSAMERVNIAAKDRKPFFLYVDEFQNFATESFASILSEARKYGLSLTMAHQYMKQLDEKVLDAIIGNVGTMMSFRIGSGDSEILAKEFAPTFLEEDFLNLPKYQIYLKLLIDGVASAPFSAQTIPPIAPKTPYKQASLQYSREHYSSKREDIERQVLEWSGMLALDPERAKHLGDIDEDEDGVPDFLQFKNKPKKDAGRGDSAGRRDDSRGADRGGRGGDRDRGGDRGRRSDGDGGGSRRNDDRSRPPRAPRQNDHTQKVLLGDPGQPGISLTSILPKKEPQPKRPDADNHRPEERRPDEHRRSDKPKERDSRGGGNAGHGGSQSRAPRPDQHRAVTPRPPASSTLPHIKPLTPVAPPPALPPRPPAPGLPPQRPVAPPTAAAHQQPAPPMHDDAANAHASDLSI